jgi:hypothetical protein
MRDPKAVPMRVLVFMLLAMSMSACHSRGSLANSCQYGNHMPVTGTAEFALYFHVVNGEPIGEARVEDLKGTNNNRMCSAPSPLDTSTPSCPPHTCAKVMYGTQVCLPC